MLDEFLGGGGGGVRCPSRWLAARSNTFPRSERAKSDPRSIDTLRVPFHAALMLESCVYAVEKCECSRGPKTDVHFAGKVLDLGNGGGVPVAKRRQ